MDRWIGSAIGRSEAEPRRTPRPPAWWTVPHVERAEGGRSTIGDLVIRSARTSDWPQLWPLIKGMGVIAESDSEQAGRLRFDGALAEPEWTIPVADFAGEQLGHAAMQDCGSTCAVTSTARWRLHDMFVRPESRRQASAAR